MAAIRRQFATKVAHTLNLDSTDGVARMTTRSDEISSRPDAARQQQFLNVIDRLTATARFQQHLDLTPRGTETVDLFDAFERVTAEDICSAIDVTTFDRSNVDGFAIIAADAIGATEDQPVRLRLNPESIAPGHAPMTAVAVGSATSIATGAMLPRGADAVVMLEDTDIVESPHGPLVELRRSAVPGQCVSFAGTDIALGEIVVRRGELLSSREIGVLAAIGMHRVNVFSRPRVAVISTGDEIVAPGQPPHPGTVFDSNSAILCAAVRELGGDPVPLGIVRDDLDQLHAILDSALKHDVVLLSGGTSKGAGDVSYRVVSRLTNPGIVAHGVALKPGKPVCLAVTDGKPVVILPGFPTSAVFTFHEFVAPVIRRLSGLPDTPRETLSATLPMRVNSERGRTEYLLVSLVDGADGCAAYPIGKGSGSVTAFSRADGFIAIDQHTEIVDAGTTVSVQLLGRQRKPVDLVAIGSHCLGLDVILGDLHRAGWTSKTMPVGSLGGLAAAQRGECDVAGIHLWDPKSGAYNRPFVTPGLAWIPGYERMQGVVFRRGDPPRELVGVSESPKAANIADHVRSVADNPGLRMINRNSGSGTRILIDRILDGRQPAGYSVQAKSHNTVAAAVVQQRADWGIAIETVATAYGLGFLPLQNEHYDFVIPQSRMERPPVQAFLAALQSETVRHQLHSKGFTTHGAK